MSRRRETAGLGFVGVFLSRGWNPATCAAEGVVPLRLIWEPVSTWWEREVYCLCSLGLVWVAGRRPDIFTGQELVIIITIMAIHLEHCNNPSRLVLALAVM